MIICKLIKEDKELDIVGIDFMNQYVVYYEVPLTFNTGLQSVSECYHQLPLSKSKLKFIVIGEENEFSISKE